LLELLPIRQVADLRDHTGSRRYISNSACVQSRPRRTTESSRARH